jgi:peptidyl-prolyl cis-trans isomerase C
VSRVNILSVTAVAFSLALLVGCQSKSTDGGAAGKKGGNPLAEVNGEIITTEEFKKEVENLPPYLRPVAETPEGRKDLLDRMIVRSIIIQQAKKNGLDKSPEIAAKLEELKQQLIVEVFLKKKLEEEAKVSDAELKKFYDENIDKFKTGDQVKASHILVKTEAEAQDVLEQIKKGGNFEELARKYSIDAAKARGGDLGWFGKGSMIPEFEKVAFAMKEGDTSGIVRSKFGYHIIKLTGKRPAGTRSFEEAKELIKGKLVSEKQQEIFAKLKDDLKKTAKYSIKEDVLKGIEITPATEQGAPEESSNK